ncbi:MAG TPA: PQQ-binding-like beta-propeller repeat protein, partial [Acidimicrobiales bacterium]
TWQANIPDLSEAAKTASHIGLFITLFVLAIVGLVTFVIFHAVDSSVKSVRHAFDSTSSSGFTTKTATGDSVSLNSTDMIVLPTPAGQAPVYVGIFYNATKDVRFIGKAKLGVPALLWKGPDLDSNIYSATFYADASRIYVAYGDQVQALNRGTGTSEWTTQFTDDVDDCKDCMTIVGGHLLVKTKDGLINAQDPVTGKGQYSRRLNNASASQVYAANGLYFMTDDNDTAGSGSYLASIKPESGQDIKSVTPTCTPPDDPNFPINFQARNPVLPVPGTHDVVVVLSEGTTCIERFNMDTGAQVWATVPLGDASYDSDHLTISGSYLLASDDKGIDVMNLGTGDGRRVLAPNDATPTARLVIGRRVVATTQSTRGTTKYGMAAWSLDTGQLAWATPPGVSEPFDDSAYSSTDTINDGESFFLLTPTATTIRTATFARTGRTLTIRIINPDTGVAVKTARTTYSGGGDTGSHSLHIAAVSGDSMVLDIDGDLSTIDLGTGKVTSKGGG